MEVQKKKIRVGYCPFPAVDPTGILVSRHDSQVGRAHDSAGARATGMRARLRCVCNTAHT